MTEARNSPNEILANPMDRSASIHVDAFAAFRRAPDNRPFVAAQLGVSLDGRIATQSGESRGINGDAALDHLHQMRAEVDAIVVGASTIVADDPQLNVRRVRGRNPVRVVLDPAGRLGPEGKWLARDGVKRLLVSAGGRAPYGAELVRLALVDGLMPPAAIVEALFELGLHKIMIEGGARTLSHFINAGCIDRLHLLMAPVILGSGKMGLDLTPITRLDQALRPKTEVFVLAGGEVVFDCDLASARNAAQPGAAI